MNYDELLRSIMGQNQASFYNTGQMQTPPPQGMGLLGGQNVQGDPQLMSALPNIMQQSTLEDKKGGLGTWGTAMLAVASSLGEMQRERPAPLAPVSVGAAPVAQYSSPFKGGQMASIMPLLMQYLGRR